MNKPFLPILAAAVGLACAVLLIQIWRHDRPDAAETPDSRQGAMAVKPGAGAAVTSGPPAFSDAAVRALLSGLERILNRPDVRPNETVLTFKDAAALARFLDRAGKGGLTVLGKLDALHAVRVRYDDLQALESDLAQNPQDYADASGNYLVSIPQVPAKEDRPAINEIPFGNQELGFIGATGDRSSWGRGVTIAVVDTGVAADPTFGAGRVSTLDIGLGTTPGNKTDDGHGTSVASLAAGASPDAPGVAPAANILSIRVTDANGTSDIFTLAQAIVSAVDTGAQVINVSMGGYATNTALESALAYAQDHGAVVVAAAGNDQAAQLTWPAADTRVISVGAVDRAGQQVTFSNSGPQLDLTAPGYGVQTAWLNDQRVYVDGTSASAPIVAGAIAAVLSQNPSLTPAEAAQLLARTASDAGAPGPDANYGNGILNLGWAMNVNNPNYVDTAVTSHYYDPTANVMDFVVQNRSDRTITGASLAVEAGIVTTNYLVPSLAPGATQVVTVPVDSGLLKTTGQIRYTTTLNNPPGIVDLIPSNNRRVSTLSAPPAK